MSENQIEKVIQALENRSVGIQNYIQGMACFDLAFSHSLNKDFKSVMCKVNQSVAVCEDFKNKLNAIREDEPHYYDLEECLREFEIPIPKTSNVQAPSKSKAEVQPEQEKVLENSVEIAPEKEDEEEDVRFTLGNSEFESIPKYMRGRMFAKDINEILVAMNEMLIHKRDLLNKPFRSLNQKEKDLIVKWKEGNAKTGNALFLREHELKEKLNEKQRLNLRNVLPCLRHVKRVREVRDKGQLILYPLWM